MFFCICDASDDSNDVGQGAVCETMARDIVLHKMACGKGEGNTEGSEGM